MNELNIVSTKVCPKIKLLNINIVFIELVGKQDMEMTNKTLKRVVETEDTNCDHIQDGDATLTQNQCVLPVLK